MYLILMLLNESYIRDKINNEWMLMCSGVAGRTWDYVRQNRTGWFFAAGRSFRHKQTTAWAQNYSGDNLSATKKLK